MQQRIKIGIGIGLFGLMLIACSLTRTGSSPTRTPSAPAVTPTPGATSTVPPVAVFPTLESFTGPYTDAVSLLDGVCFEFLSAINGETWVWLSPGDLAAFYDRADASQLCPDPVVRGSFDFDQWALAGAVTAGVGCDAAHRFAGLAQDDRARTQTLTLNAEILAGCDYELVQPFLIAVPRPPEGYTLRVVVNPP
jgi:hypothetical protein